MARRCVAVNKKAKQLAQRSQIFCNSSNNLHKQYDTSAIEEELNEECGRLEERLKLAQDEKRNLSSGQKFEEGQFLSSKLRCWQQQKIEGSVSDNTITRLLIQLQHTLNQLQALLAVTRGTRCTLQDDLDKEQLLLKETEAIRGNLEDKVSSSGRGSEKEVGLQQRLDLTSQYCDKLEADMKQFLTEHISLPTSKQPKRKQATLDTYWNNAQPYPPEDIIRALIERTLVYPHEPYLECDKDVYAPFIQLLLEVGIVQNHPKNPALIRMTPFHH